MGSNMQRQGVHLLVPEAPIVGTGMEGKAARDSKAVMVADKEVKGTVAAASAEVIIVTKDGKLVVAAGNAPRAETLAKALWAAGAEYAMQLDINSPYVLTGMFFKQADGTLKSEKFMDSMPDTASRFLRTQERDFMYVTRDERAY